MARRLSQRRIDEIRQEAQHIVTVLVSPSGAVTPLLKREPTAAEKLAAETILELCSHADHLQRLLGRWISLMSVYPAVEGEFIFALDIEGAELVSDTREVLPEKR